MSLPCPDKLFVTDGRTPSGSTMPKKHRQLCEFLTSITGMWIARSVSSLIAATGRRLGVRRGLAILLGVGYASTIAAELPELHTASQVRALSAEEAERHQPVRLRGVLTFFDQKTPTHEFRFLQDETAGIYFYLDNTVSTAGLVAGQRLELEGETGKGEFAPIVFARRIQVLGPGTFPGAKPVSFEQLATGEEDSQYVEVRGIVRSVRLEEQRLYFLLEVATGDGRVRG